MLVGYTFILKVHLHGARHVFNGLDALVELFPSFKSRSKAG